MDDFIDILENIFDEIYIDRNARGKFSVTSIKIADWPFQPIIWHKIYFPFMILFQFVWF